MQKGWIMLHRQILDNAIWCGDEAFDKRSAWIDLLLMVNHEDREIFYNGSQVVIRRGQKLTSVRKLSERWHWSRGKVSRYLTMLKTANMIHQTDIPGGTLLTVVKYGDFQCERTTKRATKRATNGPAADHRWSTNNNGNNEDNVEKDKKEASPPECDPWGNKFQ